MMMIRLIILMMFLPSCGTEKKIQQAPVTTTPVVDGPGQGPPGSPIAFSTVFNGTDREGDKTCGPCHGGQPFITQKESFCAKGIAYVRNGRMPPSGSISGSRLHEQMEAICF